MSQTLIRPLPAPASTAGEPDPGDHSTWHLPDRLSAREMLSRGQTVTLAAACAGIVAALGLWLATGLGPSPQTWAMLAVGAATVIYVAVISFRLLLVIAAQEAPVMRFSQAELRAAAASGMPVYTILVPLYREEKVLPTLVAKLARLDYPADRLQILLLIEEDDDLTRAALDALALDSRFEAVLIPPSQPRTKPKACNVGLHHARGEFVVIFDAEDRPEPDQLRKAVAAFRGLPPWVVCVQAELQYWNPWTNWLTRCFAAEYALHFSLALRGLDRFRVPIPLGGTSNHFRTDALRELGAWDPYNVTEDADLGMRIARRGWAVRMMLSVTEEEANSQVRNWIRQRSRWIKGYYQTWLVHMRSPWRLLRELGLRQFLGFQLTLGFSSLTGLLNPIFWSLTVLYLVTGPAHIRALFPGPILYLGVLSMLIGNLLMMQSMMAGCMDRGLFAAVRTMLTIPLYWALMSVAAYKAFIQLLRPSQRHYWELTQHGLVAEHGVAPLPPDPEVQWAAGRGGDPAGARGQYAALVPVRENVCSPNHPDTLETRGSLAYWTGEAGDAESARDQYATLMSMYEKGYGPDHPDTLAARANLANWAGLAGDPAAAREQHRELLSGLERAQGPKHPATLAARANLANMIGLAGDPTGARDLYAALLPVIERAQGPGHPATQSVRSNLTHWTRKAREEGPASRGHPKNRAAHGESCH
jgi:cellulose synthase/poly-beta-1,6-N-acetylglucosamine synthase-like glycosyltransferase